MISLENVLKVGQEGRMIERLASTSKAAHISCDLSLTKQQFFFARVAFFLFFFFQRLKMYREMKNNESSEYRRF